MKRSVLFSAAAVLCVQTFVMADMTLLDPGYKAELWLSLPSSTGHARGMVFDPQGNMYITTRWSSSITKITPNKQVNTSWVTGLGDPIDIEYTSGSYGNNLYVTCIGSSNVVKVDMNGNKTTFCSLNGVESIGFDRTGQYGGKLYVGTSAQDRIYSLSTSGNPTAFCSSFYNLSGSLQEIEFANSAAYGYGMCVGTWYPDNPDKSGIFKILPNGTTVYRGCLNLPDLVSGFSMDFDETGLFGNALFAGISVSGGSSGGIYKVLPSGTASPFTTGSAGITSFAFSPDGAMYLYDWTSQGTNIYKISSIPEPATLLLVSLGVLGLRRRK